MTDEHCPHHLLHLTVDRHTLIVGADADPADLAQLLSAIEHAQLMLHRMQTTTLAAIATLN